MSHHSINFTIDFVCVVLCDWSLFTETVNVTTNILRLSKHVWLQNCLHLFYMYINN